MEDGHTFGSQENKHGQLGLGDFVSSATPKPIASLHSRPVVRDLVREMWKELEIYGYNIWEFRGFSTVLIIDIGLHVHSRTLGF